MMLEIRQIISDEVTITHGQYDTYTDANANRRRIGATRAVIDSQPVELELWERVPVQPDEVDTLLEVDDPYEWVYVNTLTATVSFVLSDTDSEHDDT